MIFADKHQQGEGPLGETSRRFVDSSIPGLDDDAVHVPVLRAVPGQLVVGPHQVEPHAGRQQLVLLVLGSNGSYTGDKYPSEQWVLSFIHCFPVHIMLHVFSLIGIQNWYIDIESIPFWLKHDVHNKITLRLQWIDNLIKCIILGVANSSRNFKKNMIWQIIQHLSM